jgi:2'-5' RNA ligase
MRLFLALELPREIRARLAAAHALLCSTSPGWRWVAPDAIHLTLRFLGEVDEARDRALREAWRNAVGPFPAVRFRLEGIGAFPGPARPRVLWLGVHEEAPGETLQALAEALEAAARAGGFAAESRPFRPHLTLARARPESRPVVPSIPISIEGTAACGEVTLFRSVLGPTGARYDSLEAFPLTGAAS